jgi:5-methylcytosine-specific restriction endonuclease McrA
MKRISSRRAKACAISSAVEEEVRRRDKGQCVFCGNTINVCSRVHVVSRADGGLGIVENIITACDDFTENRCHYKLDHGTREERKAMYDKARDYLRGHYPNLDKINVIYSKYGN